MATDLKFITHKNIFLSKCASFASALYCHAGWKHWNVSLLVPSFHHLFPSQTVIVQTVQPETAILNTLQAEVGSF